MLTTRRKVEAMAGMCQAGGRLEAPRILRGQWDECFKVPVAALIGSANLLWKSRNMRQQRQLRSPMVTAGGAEESGREEWIKGEREDGEGA